MLEIKNLHKKFKENIVLNGVDLSVNKGDIIGIVGPSGTGKSTLLRSINLLERPEEGEITIGETTVHLPLTRKEKKEAFELRKHTGMVFQKFGLFEHKTALENVMEGLITVQKKSKEEAREIALKELENVGLLDHQNHYPRHMSGGQQQRVAIARTLAMKPEIILLDEPTSALDPELVTEVLNIIKNIAEQGYTMILVSHEMNFVRKISNRVIFLDGGKIIEDGAPSEVFEYPKSERAKEFFAKMNLLKEPDFII
ncbi:MAG: amino acid ABC transporter ATP-binding protein [Acholeplasmatales bacterium]|nr:amino acid ABC transporter ATP-binding protein [Acholeplasmatales bacterium]